MVGAEVRVRRLQSVQTQNMFDLTIAGNTVGAGGALISSGTLTLVGGPNITLSQDGGNIITISGGAGGAGASFDAGVSTGGNTLGTTGTVSNEIVFVGGNNITLSQSSIVGHSATITIIGGAGAAGTTFSAGISTDGNSAGSTGTVSNQIVFVGGTNITLSQSSNVGGSATITIIGPNTIAQSIQSYNILAAGTQTANTTGTVILSDSNNVSFGMSNNSVVTASASFSQSVQTQNMVSINGSTGSIVFTAGNNITLSQNLSTITISAFNQSVQPDQFNIIAAGTQTGNTTGTVVFSNSNNVSFGMSNSSVVTATVTFAQSAEPRVISLNGTSGSLSISGVSNITVSALNGSTITIYGPSNILNSFSIGGNTGTTGSSNITGGGFVLAGGSNVTLSQSNATISIHAQSQSAEPRVISLNGTSGSLSLSGASNITVSALNGSTITIYGPANILNSLSIGGNTGTTGSSNITGGGFVIAGGSNVTLSQSNNSISIHIDALSVSALNIAAGTQTSPPAGAANEVIFSDSNNVSFGMSNVGIGIPFITASFSQSAEPRVISLNGTSGSLSLSGASNITVSALNGSTITIYGPSNILNSLSISGNTGTTGSSNITGGGFVFAGGSNITLSQSNNSISIHGGAGSGIVGIANSETTFTSGTVNFLTGGGAITIASGAQSLKFSVPATSSLVQSGNVSISTNGSTITISGLGFAYASLSAGNTSGVSALISSGTMYLAGGNSITLSQGGNSITISGPQFSNSNNITFGSNAGTITASFSQTVPILSIWDNFIGSAAIQTSRGLGAFQLAVLDPKNDIFPGNMTVSTMYLDITQSTNISAAGSGTIDIGIYTRNVSTLSLLNSCETTWGFSANANNTQAYKGIRFITINSSLWSASPTFSQTQYYIGWIFTTSGNDLGVSFLGFSYAVAGQRSGTFGNSITSGNTSMGKMPFMGVASATTAALPTTVGLGDLNKVDGNTPPTWIPHIVFMNISSNF